MTVKYIQEDIEIKLKNEKIKSNNLQNRLSFLEHESETFQQSYKVLKGNNKTLKTGCKDLINKVDTLIIENEDLKEQCDFVVGEYKKTFSGFYVYNSYKYKCYVEGSRELWQIHSRL